MFFITALYIIFVDVLSKPSYNAQELITLTAKGDPYVFQNI